MKSYAKTIGITLSLVLLLTLAAIGLGGVVGYLLQRFPSTVCIALDLLGLCK